jgi:Flp pilus assembly protein TadD
MFGEDDKARVAFNRALELDPFNDEAQKNLSYLG